MTALDPIALTQALIRCRSVTPDDGGAIPLLSGILDDLGFVTHRLEFQAPDTPDILNLWARYGTGGRHFCFAGHTDVVPAGDPANWRAAPFAGELHDGFVIGRGAVDMKGAVAAFVAATQRFLARHGDFDGSISLLITGDEEGPSINGTIRVLDWMATHDEKPDACVVGEPTNERVLGDTVKVGRRGSLNATLTVKGIAGHTAYPHLADNAAHRIVNMLAALTSEPLDGGTALFQPSTLQISTIDIGNPATNVIPGTARSVFNIRFNDSWSSASVAAWLRQKLDSLGGDYDLDIKVSGESFLTTPSAIADLIADAVERVMSRRPAFTTGGGTSDARFIHHLCPVAEFGLVGQTMHKYDEAVAIVDLEALTEIYLVLLEKFFGLS